MSLKFEKRDNKSKQSNKTKSSKPTWPSRPSRSTQKNDNSNKNISARWSHLPESSVLKQYPIFMNQSSLLDAFQRIEECCRIVFGILKHDKVAKSRLDQNKTPTVPAAPASTTTTMTSESEKSEIIKTEFWKIFLLVIETVTYSIRCYNLFNRVCNQYSKFYRPRELMSQVAFEEFETTKQKTVNKSTNDTPNDHSWNEILHEWIAIKGHICYLSNTPKTSLNVSIAKLDRLVIIYTSKYSLLQLETYIVNLCKFLKSTAVNSASLHESQERVFLDDIEFIVKVIRNFSHNVDQEVNYLLLS